MLFRPPNPKSSSSNHGVSQAEKSVGKAETIFTLPPKKTPETEFNASEYIRRRELETEERIQRQKAMREAAALTNPPVTSTALRRRGKPGAK